MWSYTESAYNGDIEFSASDFMIEGVKGATTGFIGTTATIGASAIGATAVAGVIVGATVGFLAATASAAIAPALGGTLKILLGANPSDTREKVSSEVTSELNIEMIHWGMDTTVAVMDDDFGSVSTPLDQSAMAIESALESYVDIGMR
ncbi:hypothetical protein HN682_00900 [Candidatus Peregrinibacteria bacterium]|jgi:hypothetical protein|nr:hypothetical protein [Candidatus Peregrinibacteria bacterium]